MAVVIVNYQSYDELHGCLASIERACGGASVVVIDHSSNAEAADALSERFPDVQLRRVASNDGFAAGVLRLQVGQHVAVCLRLIGRHLYLPGLVHERRQVEALVTREAHGR